MADLMRRATELDPEFALAHARRTYALAWAHFLGGPANLLPEARSALERAQALAPDHPEVRLAIGYLRYWGDRNYAQALAEFDAVAAELPSSAEPRIAAGSVLRRMGRYEAAIARFEQARQLGAPEGIPDIHDLAREIAVCQWALRRYPEADRSLKEQLRLTPDSSNDWLREIRLLVAWKGTTSEAWAQLAKAPADLQPRLGPARLYLHVLDREFGKAIEAAPSAEPGWLLAYAHLRAGHGAEATAVAHRIVEEAGQELRENPRASGPHRWLGVAHALLGERELALGHATKAVELLADDAYWRPKAKEYLAIGHALLGDHEAAIDLVAELLRLQYEDPLTLQRLRLEPWWDPLRDAPRFQELLARVEAGRS
jgi:serine/threonine-protein kinase